MVKLAKKENLEFIDYFREIAILMIVAGHSLCWGKHLGNIFNLNLYLFTGGTFLFLFIAGYLFQYLSYKFDYVTYLKKKFINVILPYWFAVIPGALAIAFFCSEPNNYLYNKPLWIRFFNPFLWGQLVNGPCWYVPMITVVFLVSPLLLKIFKHKILWYSLLISGLVYTSMCFRHLLDWNSSLSANLNVSVVQWNLKWLAFNFRIVPYFIPTYMLGMEICDLVSNNLPLIRGKSETLSKIFSLTWVFCYFILVRVLKLDVAHSNISRIILIFAIFFFLIHNEMVIKSKVWLHRSLKFLAEYSFGIFFIHQYFLNPLFHHSLYQRLDVWYHSFGSHDNLESFFIALGYFCFSLFGSIIVLFIFKNILIKLGVKNTRMFIGV